MRTYAGIRLLPVLAFVVVNGCAPVAPEMSLEVRQSGWDTLHVALRWANDHASSVRSSTGPDSVMFAVFSATYDTLYIGPDSTIVVPDAALSDSEALLVEACTVIRPGRVCEQQTIFASPKRVVAGVEWEFTQDDERSKGEYEIRPVLERRMFEAEEWESLPDARIPPLTGRILVEGAEMTPLTVPTPRRTGRIDLARLDGWRDFRFHLRSAFRDSGAAHIRFEVDALFASGAGEAGSTTVVLRDKTDEQMLDELQRLVEQAGRLVLRRVRGSAVFGRSYVFVNDWRFDPASARYEAEVELHWRSFGSSSWYEITGRFTARDDGSDAVFELIDGNGRGRARWEERIQSPSLSLDDLPDPRTLENGPGPGRGGATPDSRPGWVPR